MLKVKEVTKRYVSKKGNECDALRGVSFDLPEKGLYFILGKSGSGKSTLLNLLGGLDTCTSGEIIFNGLNISKMYAAQLDVYRNEYLGFIFQEFNLIDNLSVTENVSLPLSLQSIKVEGQVEKALEEVGLSGMGARFPDELSGGQKQRVAIARALIKNPKIILADEPTGNLDSQTGKDIFELLVSLSESKLIIVVSHDAENAQKYGDGIIELEDGKVINNTCARVEEVQETPADLKKYRTDLPSGVAFKMGLANLLKKKVRSISCILVAILTIASIALSQMILSYSPEYAIYRQIQREGNSHIILQQSRKVSFGLNSGHGFMPQSTIAYIRDELGVSYLKKLKNAWNPIYIESEEELLAAGYEFTGEYLPLDKNNYYISEEYLEEQFSKRPEERPYVYGDGEFVKLDATKHNKDNLVGKRLIYSLPDSDTDDLDSVRIIAGIVATVSDKITPDNEFLMDEEINWNEAINGSQFMMKSDFDKETKLIFNRSSEPSFNFSFASSSEYFETDAELEVIGNCEKHSAGEIYTENGVSDGKDISLADGEVIISYDIYKKLFPDARDVGYYSAGNAPEHLNEKISFSVKEIQTGYECKNYENLILKGVSFNSFVLSCMYKVIFNEDTTDKLYDDTESYHSLIVNLSDVKDVYGFLKGVRALDVKAYVVNSEFYYDFEIIANQFGLVFIGLGCVFAVILLFFVINLISISIKNQQKEIGILRALGARSKDIFKIYIFESLFLAVIPFIVCLGGAFLLAWLLNKAFTAGHWLYLNLLFVNWLTVLIILFASVVLIGIATVIPLKKIVKMRPIDAIRNL